VPREGRNGNGTAGSAVLVENADKSSDKGKVRKICFGVNPRFPAQGSSPRVSRVATDGA